MLYLVTLVFTSNLNCTSCSCCITSMVNKMAVSTSEEEYLPSKEKIDLKIMNDDDISKVVSLMSLDLTAISTLTSDTCSTKSSSSCDGKKRTAPAHPRHRRNHTSNCISSPSMKRSRSHRRTITFGGNEPMFFLNSEINSSEDAKSSSDVYDAASR